MSDDGNFWTGVLVTAAIAGGLYYWTRPAQDTTIKTIPTVYAMDAAAGAEGTQAAGTTSGVQTPVASPPPLHNYSDKEGSTYYYVAGVSEEEAKTGRASGEVLSYQYGGKNDNGEHVVYRDGMRYKCSVPCKIIKVSDGRLIAFSPESLIGAVFLDAMRGHLKAAAKPKPQPVKQQPWTAYQNDPIAPAGSERSPVGQPQGDEVPTGLSADTAQ